MKDIEPYKFRSCNTVKEIAGILASAYLRIRGEWDDVGKTTGGNTFDTDDVAESLIEEKPLCLS